MWLGLNFYGWDYSRTSATSRPGVSDVKGPGLVQLLEERQPGLRWDAKAAEHYIKYKVSCQLAENGHVMLISFQAAVCMLQSCRCCLSSMHMPASCNPLGY